MLVSPERNADLAVQSPKSARGALMTVFISYIGDLMLPLSFQSCTMSFRHFGPPTSSQVTDFCSLNLDWIDVWASDRSLKFIWTRLSPNFVHVVLYFLWFYARQPRLCANECRFWLLSVYNTKRRFLVLFGYLHVFILFLELCVTVLCISTMLGCREL